MYINYSYLGLLSATLNNIMLETKLCFVRRIYTFVPINHKSQYFSVFAVAIKSIGDRPAHRYLDIACASSVEGNLSVNQTLEGVKNCVKL